MKENVCGMIYNYITLPVMVNFQQATILTEIKAQVSCKHMWSSLNTEDTKTTQNRWKVNNCCP